VIDCTPTNVDLPRAMINVISKMTYLPVLGVRVSIGVLVLAKRLQ
jgi:hypothetical protein